MKIGTGFDVKGGDVVNLPKISVQSRYVRAVEILTCNDWFRYSHTVKGRIVPVVDPKYEVQYKKETKEQTELPKNDTPH